MVYLTCFSDFVLKVPNLQCGLDVLYLSSLQARSQDVKSGGARLFLEGTCRHKRKKAGIIIVYKKMYNVIQKYVRMVSENNIFQKNIERFCLIEDMGVFTKYLR